MATAPGLAQWIPLPYGPFRELMRDPLDFQVRARERFGDVVRFRIGPMLVHFLYHPDHVRRVLYDQQKNYPRGWHYRLVRGLFGDNLVVSEGEGWRRQRRLAQPAFHRRRLDGYAAVMVDATQRLLRGWHAVAEKGEPIDVAPEMSRLALEIAGRTLFDRDVSDDADAIGGTFAEVSRHLLRRFNHPFTSPPTWVPTPANLRFKRAARTLNAIVAALVRERRQEGRDHGDLLSMLIQARDEETGEAMTDDQVRSEALTFLIAGHETTATALTWAWYLLASRPEVRRRLRDEADAAFDAANLTATRAVLDEAMRLYPPIWAVARQAVSDDDVGGFRVPAGSTVVLSPFVTHRHPEVWEKPEEFDPERFGPDRVDGIPKGAYFPFLGGPHQCIGNEFAMLEMRLIVAMVLREFDVELVAGQTIRPTASLALRPSDPVLVRIRERISASGGRQPAE